MGSGGGGQGGRILVPDVPGPLLRPDLPRRDRDELDDVIDELFPDTDEPPGWFDAGLLASAVALIGWSLAGGPGWLLWAGIGWLGLGGVLPVRWLWRRGQRARRSPGIALPTDDPAVDRLVRAYDDLLALAPAGGPATADAGAVAAHGAVLEVATLLDGHRPAGAAEQEYVLARAAAIEDLAAALRDRPPALDPARPDPTLVAQARDELDALTGGGSLARLTDLATRARETS
jgi:hypothetical protein